jgi:hypothetical protein
MIPNTSGGAVRAGATGPAAGAAAGVNPRAGAGRSAVSGSSSARVRAS